MSITTKTAWLSTDGGAATICGWCPDKEAAEARALRAGLTLTHGICPECNAKQMAAADAAIPPLAQVVPFFAQAIRENHRLECRRKDDAV